MTMKKYFVIVAMAFAAMPLMAQETYENAKIAAEDLNGTARYVPTSRPSLRTLQVSAFSVNRPLVRRSDLSPSRMRWSSPVATRPT